MGAKGIVPFSHWGRAMQQKLSKRFVAIYFGSACLLMVVAALQPGDSGKIAVFASPWSDAAPDIIARAGGRIVSTDSSGWIAISDVDDKGFVRRLYASGAVFVASSILVQACAGFVEGVGEKEV